MPTNPPIILAALTVLLLADDAFAYLDPATGSIILQSIIAGVAIGLAMLKLYWNRFRNFYRRILGKDNGTDGK